MKVLSPPAPAGADIGADITVEGDEGYTCLGENLPPSQQNELFIEGKSRYWIEARAGFKDTELLPKQRKHHGDGQNESIYSMVYPWREEICLTIGAMASVYLKSTQVSGGASQSMATWLGSGYQHQRFTGKSLYQMAQT